MEFITFHQIIFQFYLVIQAKKFIFVPKKRKKNEEYIILYYIHSHNYDRHDGMQWQRI